MNQQARDAAADDVTLILARPAAAARFDDPLDAVCAEAVRSLLNQAGQSAIAST